jgi:hypothetical protein
VDLHHLLLAGLPAHFESHMPSHAVGLCGVISDRANTTRHHQRPRLGTREFVGVDV